MTGQVRVELTRVVECGMATAKWQASWPAPGGKHTPWHTSEQVDFSLRGISRQRLLDSGFHFLNTALHILVHSRNDRGHILAVSGLVVIVRIGPYGLTGLQVAKLGIEVKARNHAIAGHFLEIVEMPGKHEIAAGIASQGGHGAKAAGGTQFAHKSVLEHFGGRLAPALIHVHAHLLGIRAIDDAIFAIKMRGGKGADQECGVQRCQLGRTNRGIGDLVVPDGFRVATSGDETNKHHERQQKPRPVSTLLLLHRNGARGVLNSACNVSHGCAPGTCSRGLPEWISEEGWVLMMSENSLIFSVTWRRFSRISSMFSELTSSVWSRRRVSSVTLFRDSWSFVTEARTSSRFSPIMPSACFSVSFA